MTHHPDSPEEFPDPELPEPDVLPPVPPPEPDTPSLRGQRHGITLARVTAAALLAKREDYPNYPAPCEGCVFREGSGPNMTHPRVHDAMKAVLEKRPMICPCRKTGLELGDEPCAGWMVSLGARAGEPPMEVPWPYSWEGPEQPEEEPTPRHPMLPPERHVAKEHVHAGTDGPVTVSPSHASSFLDRKVQHVATKAPAEPPPMKVLGTIKADVLPFIHPEPKGKQ